MEGCYRKKRNAILAGVRREAWFRTCVVKFGSLGVVQHKPMSPNGIVGACLSLVGRLRAVPVFSAGCHCAMQWSSGRRDFPVLSYEQSCIFVILEKPKGSIPMAGRSEAVIKNCEIMISAPPSSKRLVLESVYSGYSRTACTPRHKLTREKNKGINL